MSSAGELEVVPGSPVLEGTRTEAPACPRLPAGGSALPLPCPSCPPATSARCSAQPLQRLRSGSLWADVDTAWRIRLWLGFPSLPPSRPAFLLVLTKYSCGDTRKGLGWGGGTEKGGVALERGLRANHSFLVLHWYSKRGPRVEPAWKPSTPGPPPRCGD